MASVLLIDDDPDFRALAATMVEESGLSVIGEAGSVAEGRAAADELRPDAVLVDVMLPDGDGVALARELSELPWRPRVVLTSGAPDVVRDEEIPTEHVVAFVPKLELPNAPLARLLGGE